MPSILCFQRLKLLGVLCLIGALMAGCADFFPEEFQEGEFELSALDQAACHRLNDTSFVLVSTKGKFNFQSSWVSYAMVPDTSWVVFPDTYWVVDSDTSRAVQPAEDWIIVPDSSWLITPGSSWMAGNLIVTVPESDWEEALDVTEAFIKTTRDLLIASMITEVFDSLETSNVQLLKDTSLTISTPTNLNANYILLDNETENNVIIAVDDYVTITAIQEDGTLLYVLDYAVALPTVVGCPELKERSVFSLEAERYLVGFIKTDQTLGHTFHVAVLDER
ncbi:MAG: hypothetical protein ACETWG_00005 [Candidatus Neomarinimicrobiota bacterium]